MIARPRDPKAQAIYHKLLKLVQRSVCAIGRTPLGRCTAGILLHDLPLPTTPQHSLKTTEKGGLAGSGELTGSEGRGVRVGCARRLANPENLRPSLLGDKSRPAGGTGSGGLGSAFKMASPQGGQIAIAMRLRNQLQSVYKMDPLRNEVQGRRGYCWGLLAVRAQAGERTGGGGTGTQCACAATGCAVRTRDSGRVAKCWTRTPARCV